MTIERRSFDQDECKVRVKKISEIKIDFISNMNKELDYNDGTAFAVVELPYAGVIGEDNHEMDLLG